MIRGFRTLLNCYCTIARILFVLFCFVLFLICKGELPGEYGKISFLPNLWFPSRIIAELVSTHQRQSTMDKEIL